MQLLLLYAATFAYIAYISQNTYLRTYCTYILIKLQKLHIVISMKQYRSNKSGMNNISLRAATQQ